MGGSERVMSSTPYSTAFYGPLVVFYSDSAKARMPSVLLYHLSMFPFIDRCLRWDEQDTYNCASLFFLHLLA